MDQQTFRLELAQEHYPEPITVTRMPGELGEHSHPFEAKALILDGSVSLTINGNETTYLAGDIFHLLANIMHSERYGPQGVTYLVGRKETA